MHTIRSGYKFWNWRNFRHYFDPFTYIDWVKHYYQRATRGWADCDTWGLDNYLSEWLPGALKHLREHKHGIPCDMFTEEEMHYVHEDGATYPPTEAYDRANQRWDDILVSIIAGFEAYNRMKDSLYEDELGPYPLWNFDKINEPDPIRDKRTSDIMDLEKRDMEIFKKGMALFVEHFGSLWD